MKKSFFTLLMLSVALFAGAQETEKKEVAEQPQAAAEQTVKGFHPYDTIQNRVVSKEYSHWSIIPMIGFNLFDGDFGGSEVRHSVYAPSAAISAEYSFTPIIGLGLQYAYTQYHVTGIPGVSVPTLLHGHLHNPALYVSVDLMNAMFPRAKRKIFNWQVMAGAGMGFYKSTAMYHDDDAHGRNTAYYINKDGAPQGTADYMKKYDVAPNILIGTNFEFNLNRTLALGLRIDYNYFLHDRVDGRGYMGEYAAASKNNDGIVNFMVNLRVKLDAVKKTHVRNIPGTHYSHPSTLLGTQDPIFVHDTTIIYRDTTVVFRDTTVIFRDTTVIETQVVEQKEIVTEVVREEPEQIYYIYFDPNKTTINNEGLITIQQAADRLAADSTLYALCIGYCDNTGSKMQNYILGDKRAAAVEEELHKEHGIESHRLFSCGYGIVEGGRSNAAYGPNRRVGIQLVKQDAFEQKREELKKAKEERFTKQ